MTELKAKTIYFPVSLIETIGDSKNFSARTIDLIVKGLSYEEDSKKLTSRICLEYLVKAYNASHKDKPIVTN